MPGRGQLPRPDHGCCGCSMICTGSTGWLKTVQLSMQVITVNALQAIRGSPCSDRSVSPALWQHHMFGTLFSDRQMRERLDV